MPMVGISDPRYDFGLKYLNLSVWLVTQNTSVPFV